MIVLILVIRSILGGWGLWRLGVWLVESFLMFYLQSGTVALTAPARPPGVSGETRPARVITTPVPLFGENCPALARGCGCTQSS